MQLHFSLLVSSSLVAAVLLSAPLFDLAEEFKRSGCEVVFVDHPISDDPNDQLLLQIQGAIAEYERVLLGERFRRGKLQKAREGHFIGSRASYGFEELQERRSKIAQRREALGAQYEQQSRLRRQAAQAREVLEDLETFCRRINARLEDATFEEKQAILQLLIERIIVGEDTLEIRHIIPLDGPPRNSTGSVTPPESGLRSDGVHPAPLPGGSL